MDASILVVGGNPFITAVTDQIGDLAACTIQLATSPQEAAPLIQAQQPDILILQAEQPGSLDLCAQIKGQSRLAWIYCILMHSQANARHDAMLQAEALERGADAYLYQPLSQPDADSPELEKWPALERLLKAQIHAGLRIVSNHREIIRTNDLLSAIALSDPLTELNNRRALEWELPRQIQNARSRSTPMSLVMLDVDYFKSINDTYGHLVGDRTLKILSLRLRNNLRFYDTPFRYGGEEFVIILSNTDIHEAPQVAHRICRLISNKPFTVDTMDSVIHLHVTVSAGVASLEAEDDPRGTSLLKRADQNLLRAKSSGRNQVMSHQGSLPNTPLDLVLSDMVDEEIKG